MANDDILDQDLVTELRDIMGEGFAALVESYQQDTDSKLADMRAALVAGETARLRQLAHSLKGSSGNLGALQVAKACMALEQAAESKELAASEAVLQQVASAAQRALEVLREQAAG